MNAERLMRTDSVPSRTDREALRPWDARADSVRNAGSEAAPQQRNTAFGESIAEARRAAERQQANRRSEGARSEGARSESGRAGGRSRETPPPPHGRVADARATATVSTTTKRATEETREAAAGFAESCAAENRTPPAPTTDSQPGAVPTLAPDTEAMSNPAPLATASMNALGSANPLVGAAASADTAHAAGEDAAANAAAAKSAQAANALTTPGNGCAEEMPAACSTDRAKLAENAASGNAANRAAGDFAAQRAQAGGAGDAPAATIPCGLAAAPGATQPAHPMAPIHSGSISTAVGQPAFATHFAVEVALLTSAGIERAQIDVQPPDLGPVHIELSLSGEAARIAFSATQPDTRQAIEQSLPILKDMLAERGIVLSDATVSGGRSDGSSPGESSSAPMPRLSQDQRHAGGEPGAQSAPRRVVALRGLLDVYA